MVDWMSRMKRSRGRSSGLGRAGRVTRKSARTVRRCALFPVRAGLFALVRRTARGAAADEQTPPTTIDSASGQNPHHPTAPLAFFIHSRGDAASPAGPPQCVCVYVCDTRAASPFALSLPLSLTHNFVLYSIISKKLHVFLINTKI